MKKTCLLLVTFLLACLFGYGALASETEMKMENDILLAYTGHEETCTIPDGIREIAPMAFYGNETLREVYLPGTLRSIGDNAFANCTALEDVHMSRRLEKIGKAAFYNCASLKKIELPERVETLGEEAFAHCRSLEAFALPEGMESIARRLFTGCSSLKELALPAGLKSIQEEAFAYCTGLKMVTLPEGFTDLGARAFHGCTGIRAINIPTTINLFSSGCLPSQKNMYLNINDNKPVENMCKEENILYTRTDSKDPEDLWIDRQFAVREVGNDQIIHYGSDAIDKEMDTCWIFDNNGQYINLYLQQPGAVNAVRIVNGYHRTKDSYERYGRPKKVEISFHYVGTAEDDFRDPVAFDVDNEKDEFFLMEFDWRLNVDAVRITALQCVGGTEFKKYFCITELRVVGKKMKYVTFEELLENGCFEMD